MLNYESIKALSDKIEFYHFNRQGRSWNEDEELQAENDWAASYFCTEVLYHSTQQKYHCIRPNLLKALHKEFVQETSIDVKLEDLITQGWVRIVFDMVFVSKAIEAGAREIIKALELKNEIEFLLGVKEHQEMKNLTLGLFDRLKLEHEVATNIILNLQSAKDQHFWNEKDGGVQISDLSAYVVILERQNEFLFISKLSQALNSNQENNLQITTELLSTIHTLHKQSFPLTPSLEDFIRAEAFKLSEDQVYYTIHFRYCKMPVNGFIHDKTGSLLWNKLKATDLVAEGKDKLLFWYCRMILEDSHCEIKKFFPIAEINNFIDIALEVVLSNKDVDVSESELMKMRFDGHHSRLHNLEYYLAIANVKSPLPNSKDLYKLYEQWRVIDRDHDEELILGQRARRPISYLISQIVFNDEARTSKRILSLLSQGKDKPYVFLKTCFTIYYFKPQVIPFLIQKSLTVSALGIRLLYKAEFNSVIKDNAMIKTELIAGCFSLILEDIASDTTTTKEEKALLIYHCISKAVEKKYSIKGPHQAQREKASQEFIELSNSIKKTYSVVKAGGVIHDKGIRYDSLFFPSLLPELIEVHKNYEKINKEQSRFINIPYEDIDLLMYFVHLSKSLGNRYEAEWKNTLTANALDALCLNYLNVLHTKEIETFNYFENKVIKETPSWSDYPELKELIDWSQLLLWLEEERLLEDFLNPKEFKFKSTSKDYDQYNQFVAEKIRTHLSILLSGYNKIFKQQRELIIEGLPVARTLSKLENEITSIIVTHSTTTPSKKRYDIFNEILERGYGFEERQELLPIVGNILNKFKDENKITIIEELIKSDKFVRALKLIEYVMSEKEKKQLLETISKHDVLPFLKEASFNDRRFIIQSLSSEKEFIQQAEKALEFLEGVTRGSRQQFKHEEQLIHIFRMKLLLAYQKNDEQFLEQIESPLIDTYLKQEFSATDEKDFYKALIYLKRNEPHKAYNIFNGQLSYAKEERPTLALNRFASKLTWAEITENRSEKLHLFKEAIVEWNKFEGEIIDKKKLQYIEDNIWYNKLHAYEGLENEVEFDKIYSQLDVDFKLRKDFIELAIKSYLRRKMQHHAESLLNEAKVFHRLHNGDYSEFIHDLEKLVSSNDTLQFLKTQYSRIFNSAPEYLIQIIPEERNKGKSLAEFILGETISAANNMLTNIHALPQVKLEDNYSALIISSLNDRLSNFHWTAAILRGGSSDSKLLNPGEIDFGISSGNNERLAVCEAMILKGKNTVEVQKHNLKIFNYDHQRNLFFLLVYYKGKADGFTKAWSAYRETVEVFIEFPTEYKLKSKNLIQLKGWENESIKVAKSKHGYNTQLFHVFININYRLILQKKKVGTRNIAK